MKKISLLAFIAVINVLFAFLLINKQNKIVTYLYEIQQLQEQRKELLESKKNLLVGLQKEQQLSTIQAFAQAELDMQPITIKEVKTISLGKEQDDNQQ